jgi:hypothetical protein
MDAFEAVFADTSKVTGTMRVKLSDNHVRTGKLTVGPADMSEEAFAAASLKGATLSERVGDSVRSRTRTRKDVTGAAARSAVLSLLGFTLAAPSDDAKPDAKPDGKRKNGSYKPVA